MKENNYIPKIDEVCLINFPDIDSAWYEYTVNWIGEYIIVASCKDVNERTAHICDIYIKPLPTEKEKMIEELVSLLKSRSSANATNDKYTAKYIIDVGYRKMPELRVEVKSLCGLKL